MKVEKYLSSTSIVIASVFVLVKLQLDFVTYHTMRKVIVSLDGDFSPSIAAGEIKTVALYLIPVLISLILSIIGYKKRNSYRKVALGLNLLTLLYLIIPVGFLLALAQKNEQRNANKV